MFNITDPNLSYILFSPESKDSSEEVNKKNCEKACSMLYSKDYTVLFLTGLYEGNYEKSFLAIQSEQNDDELRKDLIYFLDSFHQECGIIKYRNDDKPHKIFENGTEKPLSVILYNSDSNNKTYLYDGISFSFNEEKRYHFFRKKEELKPGMIVEYLNNNKWIEREIINVDSEYKDLYELLMKYSKVRISVN
jgi:hypothetical protein